MCTMFIRLITSPILTHDFEGAFLLVRLRFFIFGNC